MRFLYLSVVQPKALLQQLPPVQLVAAAASHSIYFSIYFFNYNPPYQKYKLCIMSQNPHQEYQKQREDLFQQEAKHKASKIHKILMITSSILVIILLSAGTYAYIYYTQPGPYDNFAKCLTQKGAVMYGAIQWCKYTQGQANMFGKSFHYINYHDESELAGLKTRPTWVINGKWYEKVQSFDTLAAATGCSIN